MISEENLMQSNRDWGWVDEYAKRMGDEKLCRYSRELFRFLYNLEDDSEIIITNYVKKESEDLFAKCCCRFVWEGSLNLQFSVDFTRLRKFENKPQP